jgi:hypothetical protein
MQFFFNKKIYIYFFFLLWFFSINLGTLIFETIYRDNTIYFPVSYNFLNLKENPFSQVQYDWGWSNGRWLGALFESNFIFKIINTVNDLQISKIIGIFLNFVASIIFFTFLQNIKKNYLRNFIISTGIFSLPGFIFWNFLGGLNQHLTYVVTIIIGFYLHQTKSNVSLGLLYFFSYFCFTNYPPLFFLILIFPVSIILFDNKSFIQNFDIFKKYLFVIIFTAFFFYISKTFFIEYIYKFVHGDLANVYPYFYNNHPNYTTSNIFNPKNFLLIFYKLYLYITLWFKSDFNFWNIYISWIPVIIFFFLIYLLLKNKFNIYSSVNSASSINKKINQKNFTNNCTNKYYLIIALYFLPIFIWLPLNSQVIAYRTTASTSAIIFLLLIHILENFRNKKFKLYFFYFLIFFSYTSSSFNCFQNARNAYLEFKYVTEKLKQIDKKIKHVHIMQPEVGYGYNGLPSINEEFNRPSLLTWQENTRYLHAAGLQIDNFMTIFHDCETNVYVDKNFNFPIYKVAFPKKWDLETCLNNLRPSWVLVTFSHPHRYVDEALNNQDHLNIRSRYTDLTDQSYEDLNYKVSNYFLRTDTLIINLSEIQKKIHTNEKKNSWERKLYRKIFSK